jgi:hypothetical protein
LLDDAQKLSQYKVIYLADNVYVSDNQIKNLKQFVNNGGGLIASFSTSLYTQDGKRNSSFALADLLKVKSVNSTPELENYQAMIGGPNDLYLSAKKEFKGLEKWQNQLLPAWYYEPVQVENGGQVVMNIVTGDGERPVLPGVVLSQYGKGKVLYCASSIESLFRSNGNPQLKSLIGDFISLVAPTAPSYSMKAPSALIANMTTDNNNYLLHLTNWTGNKFEKTHLMEDYISPVENIRVKLSIPSTRKIVSIKSITGSKYTVNKTGNSVEILLPRVEAYEGILIETR